ncbi:uncharacterized protein LY89DRAFT_787927 [Mollisia scopiformis]|uniref:Uncharacterized protein n=1 Tax=Mollisia scopiformis TaxID=149040 RepID=A0A132BB47_MOLSC|nr:uncharacterized protein LY89DRAFT_787927 [Mollisia scopiformis]KUJ09642.1 hypothetical protein LY89DRAFT_787927 [Mollisia scopiformis]
MLDNPAPPSTVACFRAFISIISQSNELTSCFNPWVITPTVPYDELETSLNVNPVITTVAYAILEPLITKGLLHLAVPPWTLLLGFSPFHIMWSLNMMIIYTGLYRTAQSSMRTSLGYEKPPSVERGRSNERDFYQLYAAGTFVLPVISSATINATLLLFSQSLYEESLIKQPRMLLLAFGAILTYLGCRFGDYVICKETRRGRSLSQAIFYQLMLSAIRGYVRILVGFPPFMAFQIPDTIEIEQRFGSERYQWIKEISQRYPFKYSWVLALVSVPLGLLGQYLMRTGMEERAT